MTEAMAGASPGWDYEAVIIGGGQSGLATAYYLRKYGVRFVVLDANEQPGGAWPHYWDSLTLFSRAEFSNLPGWPMPDADGFPPRDHVVEYLTRYEARYALPVRHGERVERVKPVVRGSRPGEPAGLRILPQDITARHVVVATGVWSAPFIPYVPGRFPGTQLHAAQYRRPEDLAEQRVAVIGAGNSGAQITADLALASRSDPDLSIDARWYTRSAPAFMPDGIDGSDLFRRNRQRFLAIARGEEDPGGADFGGDIVAVPAVRRARDAGLLEANPMVGDLAELQRDRVDTIVWATGFRPALTPVRGLPLDLPNLHVVGFDALGGPGAGTIGGVGPFAREVASQIARRA